MVAGGDQRSVYQSSGRTDWERFLPLALAACSLAVVMAGGLSELYRNNHYYVVVAPFAASLPVLGAALIAVSVGRCRSRGVATLLAVVAACVLYFGYYEMCLARIVGFDNAARPAALAAYVDWRLHTDRVRGHAQAPNVAGRGANQADLFGNWFLMFLELGSVAGVMVVALRARAGRAYCERCGRWTAKATMKLPAGVSGTVLRMLRAGTLDRLSRTSLGTVEGNKSAELAVEFCEPPNESEAPCPVFLTLRDQTARLDKVSLGDRVGQYFQFRTRFKTAEAVRQLELTDQEAASIAEALPALKTARRKAASAPAPGRAALYSSVTLSRTGPLAQVEKVPEEFAGQVLRPFHAICQTIVGVLPVVVFFGYLAGAAKFSTELQKLWPPAEGLLVAGIFVLAPLLLVYSLFYINYFTARYMRSVTWRAFDHRPDCWLDLRDPDLVFVDVIPRANWGKEMMENASDIGFLCIDGEKGEIVFEGDRERYRIPREAITGCGIESFEVGQGAVRKKCFLVVVKATTESGPWETWFWRRHPDLRPYTNARRLAVARQLEARISNLLPWADESELSLASD